MEKTYRITIRPARPLKKSWWAFSEQQLQFCTCIYTWLVYSTRNGKFKRLEPNFQLWARSAAKEGMENAVALPHSRECTKEPISAMPTTGSMDSFGARAELRISYRKKIIGTGMLIWDWPIFSLGCNFFLYCQKVRHQFTRWFFSIDTLRKK